MFSKFFSHFRIKNEFKKHIFEIYLLKPFLLRHVCLECHPCKPFSKYAP